MDDILLTDSVPTINSLPPLSLEEKNEWTDFGRRAYERGQQVENRPHMLSLRENMYRLYAWEDGWFSALEEAEDDREPPAWELEEENDEGF